MIVRAASANMEERHMESNDELPNGDEDHEHHLIGEELYAMESALHLILCTILDELEQSRRDNIRRKLNTYRSELFGNDDREQSWIGSGILRFIWAMDNHTPLKDIDPYAP